MHVEISADHLYLPRRRFEIASGAKESADVFIVNVMHGSVTGLGSGTPATSAGDSVMGCKKGLALAKGLQIDPSTYFDEEDDLEIRDVSPSAAAAVDIAMWDLYSKSNGITLASAIGDQVRDVITDATIDLSRPDEAGSDASKLASLGFTRIKVKVGKSLQDDLERLEAVRRGAGREVKISIDANGGYVLDKAFELWQKASGAEIEFFEQPVPQDKIADMAKLRKKGVRVCADESVRDEESLQTIVEAEAADIVNIKLMKCGGISSAIEMAGIAREAGMGIMVGCMGDIGISIGAAAHFACGINAEYADLDSHLNITQVCDGPSVQKGSVVLQEAPGHGTNLINGWRDYRVQE